MATVPPTPWIKGVHPQYSAFVIEVHICRDSEGNVHSLRRLQDELDETTVETLSKNQGMEEGSFGLLIEAARHEAMLQILIRVTHDEDFRDMVFNGSSISDSLLEQVTQDTLKLMWKTLSQVGQSVVRETLDQVRHGLKAE
jgi:hypothetical protein